MKSKTEFLPTQLVCSLNSPKQEIIPSSNKMMVLIAKPHGLFTSRSAVFCTREHFLMLSLLPSSLFLFLPPASVHSHFIGKTLVPGLLCCPAERKANRESFNLAGAKPFKTLQIKTNTFNLTQQLADSQCRSWSIGVKISV